MNATRNASYDDLYGDAYDRLDAMMDMGVTTVEGKSGYGLDLATELIQLRVMKELNDEHPLDVVSTFSVHMLSRRSLPGVRTHMSIT